MKLKKPPPSQRGTRHTGSMYTRYRNDGSAIVSAWPRARGRPKSPVTQQQVALWDRAIHWAKTPEPKAYDLALTRSAGSGFYARDILIMETFGTDISWPGWGKYPDGPESPEGNIPKGYVKSIDAPFRMSSYRDSGTITVTMDLWLPASPKLYLTTIEPHAFQSLTRQEGKSVPHGLRLWSVEALGEYNPDNGTPTSSPIWTVPDPAPNQDLIWFWAAEKGSVQPVVDWSSAAYPLGHTGPAPSFGYHTAVIGFSNVPTGEAPDPETVAELNAAQDTIKACLITQPGMTIIADVREARFAHCDAAHFDGTSGPSGAPACYNFNDRHSATLPGMPTCAAPSPTRDTYYWYLVYLVSA